MLFLIMCLRVRMCTLVQFPQRPEEGSRPRGAGVTGECEPSRLMSALGTKGRMEALLSSEPSSVLLNMCVLKCQHFDPF